MIKSINKKIKHVQRQPEKVRLKYIFIFVTIAMTLVVVLWFFTIQEGLRTVIRATPEVNELLPVEGLNQVRSLQEVVDKQEENINNIKNIYEESSSTIETTDRATNREEYVEER